jgi:phospholipid/cholesterol/gamma-HCH transport system substrate-binding protein
MRKEEAKRNLRVGVFVAAALTVLALAIFAIGQERSMFTPMTRLYTSFPDINGLVIGAPVRLAGVDVGRVTEISFSETLDHAEARVELSVETRYMERLRLDSRAYIDSKGLLGDKLINLTVGTPSSPALEDGGYVMPRAGSSLEGVAKELEATAGAIGRAAQSAQGAVNELASPEVTDNVRRITTSIAAILEQIERGDGLAHRLVYDPGYAERVDGALANLERMSARASDATARADRLLARAESGPGTVHALLYEDHGTKLLTEVTRAASGVADTTDALNHGEGLAAAVMRDPAGRQLVLDLAALSSRLERISQDVENGRGTVGALLVDPSVYEEMKTVLGNIERSTVLKALIRMTIKEESLARPPQTARPAQEGR